jgi:hypothetical protein
MFEMLQGSERYYGVLSKKQAEVSATAQKGEAAKKTELIKEIQLSKLK